VNLQVTSFTKGLVVLDTQAGTVSQVVRLLCPAILTPLADGVSCEDKITHGLVDWPVAPLLSRLSRRVVGGTFRG